jgi:hypothetical protein
MTENDLSAGVGKENKGIKDSNWNRYLAKERENLTSVNFLHQDTITGQK